LGNRKGQVILGCLPLTRARLVPDAIRALISKYPDINVRVVDGIFPALFAMLMHGEMDILAGTLRDALPEGTNAQFLLYDRVSIVVRPEHPLARKRVVTLAGC
jgi:LysR family transcriptional regulator of gallate degradation